MVDVRHLLVGLSLILVTAFAQADSAREVAWTRAAAASLPVYFEDRSAAVEPAKAAQLTEIARVVADVSRVAPRPPREWAALLLTIGYHESGYSLRIHRGECRPRECDAGRARSGWQLHKNLHTAPVWDQLFGLEHTEVQVRAADQMLRRAFYTCSRSGVPWLQATLSAYAGKRCGVNWEGLRVREVTWARLVKVAVPAGGAS